MKFETLAMEWFEGKRKYLKESTEAYYLFELQNYILPDLGDIEVECIDEEIIQKTVCNWQMGDNKKNRKIKKSTISNLVMLIRQIMQYGGRKKNLVYWELKISYLPESCENKEKTFTDEEQDLIVDAVTSNLSFKSFGILLSLSTGIRIGELCALRWNSFDNIQNVITIRNTLQRVYDCNVYPRTRIITGDPKTMNSVRNIPISRKLQDVINQLSDIDYNGYVLTNNSTFLEPRAFRRYYKNFLIEHNIKYLNFHCLRHSFATRLIQKGADYKCVSELLGHASINTTLNMYVHPNLKQKRNCMELF